MSEADGRQATLARLSRTWDALGGIAAQGSQAGASFVLQILAVRLLGLEGLGVFAALYGIVIVATGVATGFVGDSLTVLDRSVTAVRAGLQTWWAGLSAGLGLIVAAGAWATGMVEGRTALAFGLATTLFLLEDALRRLLMATLRFWSLVLVDLTALAAALATIFVIFGPAGLGIIHLLLALAIGQATASVVAVLLLPASERHLSPWRGADLRTVGAYGTNRAVQLSLRPGLQAVTRLLGLALVSAVAVGELEAARVYIAPTLIVIGGLVSVLFAHYAAAKHNPLAGQMRLADRHALYLAAGSGLLCGGFLLSLPWLGPVLTGGAFDLSTLALVGWTLRSMAFAGSMPFMSLAAIRGMQRITLTLTLVEFAVVLCAVVTLLMAGGSILWVPYLLAIGTATTGAIVRTRVLPRARAQEAAGAAQVRGPHD